MIVKNQAKKLLSVFLAAMMILSVSPAMNVFAADIVNSGNCGKNLTWTLDSEGTLTISGEGLMYDWEDVGDSPWYDNAKSIKKVIVKDGVTSIGTFAFGYNTNLAEVVIPATVMSIDSYAFVACDALRSMSVSEDNHFYSSLNGILFNKDKTTLIKYPAKKAEDNYDIPNSVTRIDDFAFEYNTSLKSIVIPESVTYIGREAFSGCTGLTDIKIPDSVTLINCSAFSDCTGLTKIIIGNGVTSLEDYMFSGCTDLTSVIIGNNVTMLGWNVFEKCTNLTSVTIPDSVTNIGMWAFVDCAALESIIIGKGVTDIDSSAFEDCRSLKSIRIPKSVTYIGEFAFEGCNNLAEITVSESNANYLSLDGVLFSKDKTELLKYPAGKAESNYVIPSSVTSIDTYAFGDCSNLTDVTIPNSVTCVDGNAFYNCINLASIRIPKSVVEIGYSAFGYYDDENNELTSVENFIIYGYKNSAAEKYANDNDFEFKSACQHSSSSRTEQAEISPTCTENGYTAGVYCNECEEWLSGHEIIKAHHTDNDNDGICDICGEGAVPSINVGETKTVTLAEGESIYFKFVPEVSGKYTFESHSEDYDPRGWLLDHWMEEIEYDEDSADGLNFSITYYLKAGETYYWQAAFSSGTEYGSFDVSLTTYESEDPGGTCGEDITWMLESNGTLTISGTGNMTDWDYYDDTPWYDYRSSIQWVYIENGVKTIGNFAFANCRNLSDATLPDGLTKIGKKAFYNCNNLSDVTIPDSVTSIEYGAFSDCKNITSITIPAGVTSIGEYAFGYYDIGYEPTKVDDFTTYGYNGTAAEEYATENGFEFVSLGDIHAHSYEETVEQAATCTVDGVMRYTCSCGDSYTAAILAPGHTSVKLDAVLPTCTTDGKTDGEKCSVCGEILVAQKIIKAAGHKPITTKAVTATCTKNGKTEEIKCSVCGVVIKAASIIKAKGHTYATTTIKATLTKDGSTVTKCKFCQALKSKTTIASVKTVSLSKTAYTYNGKTQRPSVVVKDRTGKILKNGTDYTVKYSSGCKNVGQYTVTVTLKGNYTGTKTLTFKIVPKGTSISKLTAGKKQFTAKWSAQTAQTTGYELQYSTKSSMSGAKTVTVGKNKTTSAKVKKLKGKKKYYARVRAYKIVKIGGKNVKLYSSWSKVKSVKTK